MDSTTDKNERRRTRSSKTKETNLKRKRVEDETEEVESQPRPNKESKMADDLGKKLDELKSFMERKLDENKKEISDNTNEAVDRLSRRMDQTEKGFTDHKNEVEQRMRRMQDDINALSAQSTSLPPSLGNPRPAGIISPSKLTEHDLRAYWFSRKCLYLFPVKGEIRKELWAGLEEYLGNMLKIPSGEVLEEEIVDVRRRRVIRGREPRGEVMVVFANVDVRDRVASYARNLAGRKEAGVRMDVPAFLGGVHKTLLQYGHSMKNKYGVEYKRNIRFDDPEHTLVIDMKTGKNQPWITVGYRRALEDRRSLAAQKELQHGDILSSRRNSEYELMDEDLSEAEGRRQGDLQPQPQVGAGQRGAWGANK